MTRVEAEKRIEDLSNLLRKYQYEYYILSRPTVSDAEYDRLFDELLSIEKNYPDLVKPDSPSKRIGSDLSQELPEVHHTIPVLSLDKAYSYEDVLDWINKADRKTEHTCSFVLEEKIDGSSIVLYYENGILIRAVTRGNGEVGNDVTGNVKTINTVPLKLSKPVSAAVRGEIYLPKNRFNEINRKMGIPYANPRNLASGTLRRVKSSEVALVPLDIFVYEGFFEKEFSTHVEILDELSALGFRLNPHIGFFSDSKSRIQIREKHPYWSVGAIKDIAEYLGSKREERKSLQYEIDGIVVKVNEIPQRDALGYTGHHPRWAIAYKFEAPEGATNVKAISVQVGRTGRVTPVARVEPVEISGSTISNVTLHNQDYIDMLELAVGDRVAVSKRGDVIPAVERVLEKNERGNTTWKMPDKCPSCGSRLKKIGAHHFCTNNLCPAQVRGRLLFFVARGQMDIESLGPETIDVLIDKGWVSDVSNLYTFNPDLLLELPGFGEKKVQLIRDGIKRSKDKPFRTVLKSLGIPEVGPKVIELLIVAGYRDIDSLFELADRGDYRELLDIHGIGDKTALTIIDELKKPHIRIMVEKLKRAGLQFKEFGSEKETKEKLPQIFAGQTWCVTGSFENFKPRDLAMEEVKKRGGRVVSNVTSKTTHLLAGTGAGSKLDKALSFNVKIVKENEFLKLI